MKIEQILDAIEFRESVMPFYAQTNQAFYNFFESLFKKLCPELVAALSALETEHQQRFLLAAPTSAVLRTAALNNSATDFGIAESLENFSRFVKKDCEGISNGYVAPDGSIHKNENGQIFKNSYCHGIVLDFDFPLVWAHVDFSHQPLEVVYEIATRKKIAKKINAAIEFLQRERLPAWELVSSQTQIFHIRRANKSMGSGSSSNLLRNGATVLRGLELDEVSVFDVAEFIVHEAIHHLLYKYEILTQEIIDTNSGQRPILDGMQSPWSHNYIAVDSYVHACFVWFGVYNLWKKLCVHNIQTKYREITARCGFAGNRSLLDPLQMTDVRLDPEFQNALIWMENEVKGEVRGSLAL